MSETPPILWEPSAELVENARLTEYRRWLAAERGVELDGYEELWRWSVEDLEAFWRSIWDYFGVRSPQPPGDVLADRTMPGAKWFPGTQVNYAEHVLQRQAGRPRGDPPRSPSCAPLSEMTWGELRRPDRPHPGRAGRGRRGPRRPRRRLPAQHPRDRRGAAGRGEPRRDLVQLRARVRGHSRSSTASRRSSPRCCSPSTATATAGATSTAARWCSELAAAIPSLEHGVHAAVPRRRGGQLGRARSALPGSSRSSRCPSTIRCGCCTSSGTTGLPKAIVQGHGGILLEHLKKLRLHADLARGRPLFWFTTTGWMMWNFLVSAAADRARRSCSTTARPRLADLNVLWDLAAERA